MCNGCKGLLPFSLSHKPSRFLGGPIPAEAMFGAGLYLTVLRQALSFAHQHQSSWNHAFPLPKKALENLEW